VAWLSQVSETVILALQITVVGMSLVFLTLGLIILAVVLLTRLPGLRSESEPEETPKVTPAPTPTEAVAAETASPDDQLARVAAIAVALLRSRSSVRPYPRTRARRGAWKSYGRAHQIGL
jgi:sodium pump decarboxylase gamma subunit